MSNIFDKELAERHPFATSMVTAAINSNKLSHAYLLSGRALDDKWKFAQEVAAHLNCANKSQHNNTACQLAGLVEKDQCVNCKWINERKHPQAWIALTSEGSKSGKIAVEKARALSEELSKHSEFFRVVIVEDSSQEAFHRPSANALLKTIEDPGARCLFFLFAIREEDVLPTVVSRCQVTPMASPPGNQSALASTILKTGDNLNINPELKSFSDAVKNIFKNRDSHLTLYALDLARQIHSAIESAESIDDGKWDPVDVVLDLAINLEINRVGERASFDRAAAGYLADLLSLSEEVKLQLTHYVSSKAAIETFVLSWWRLRATSGC